MNEEARKWLAEHSDVLQPEEIIFEQEKLKLFKSGWPVLSVPPNNLFREISSSREKFNKIVGDPNNWDIIREDDYLFKNWVLPNAILLFGKYWYDRVKLKSQIRRGAPFSLFTTEEKTLATKRGVSLSLTNSGRAKIEKIKVKVLHALKVYLEAKWYKNDKYIKKPGPYIISSLQNEFTREIGKDLGYKLKNVKACPNCLARNKKVILEDKGDSIYSCPVCSDKAKNDDLDGSSNFHMFVRFNGTTCVCPNKSCPGKYIPIKSNYKAIKSVRKFKTPNKDIINANINCPYCDITFIPKKVVNSESHSKNSGLITGLPTVSIWIKEYEELTTSDNNSSSGNTILVSKNSNIESNFLEKQKLGILVNELIIKLSTINKNKKSGLISWCFYEAVIKWILTYSEDAYKYFFEFSKSKRDMTNKEKILYPGQNKKNITLVSRGKYVSVHQAIFHFWMDILEENMSNFKIISNVKHLKDFNWFCKGKKYPNGPIYNFTSKVKNGKISNTLNIGVEERFQPRIAKVLCLFLKNSLDENLIDEIFRVEWQTIILENSLKLKDGDEVLVTALMMPGHTTHAPIQRIIRLRKYVLLPVINQILIEEETGNINKSFWQKRTKKLDKAKSIVSKESIIKKYIRE